MGTSLFQVYDILCKSLSNWETEPLKGQVKTILTHILSCRHYTKLQKLKAAKEIVFDDVSTFARKFFLEHSTECFFFGDLTVDRAEEFSTIVLNERTQFLERLAENENVHVDTNPFLEEWFLTDPVERIVSLESALLRHQNTVRSRPFALVALFISLA